MLDERQQEAAAIVAAVASGQRRALGQLVTLYGQSLTALATQYLGRRDDAEEVVQDVFVRVWRHAGRYDPAKARVSTWLYRIAVNLCIDRRRKRAFLRIVGLEEAEIPDPQPTPADRIDGAARLAAVRAAIEALPHRQRMAILLRAVGELETAEVAAAMGIGTGAAEQLLVRARRTLRQQTRMDLDKRS